MFACSGIFLRSFHLHSIYYARETIAKICSLGAALATAPMSQTGSAQRAAAAIANRGGLPHNARPHPRSAYSSQDFAAWPNTSIR